MESAGFMLTNCQACCPARGIRILCAAGCKLQKRNILGQTAFEIAAALGKDMALEELAKQAGPDNRHASNALYFASACCGGSAQLVQRLVQLRADVNAHMGSAKPLWRILFTVKSVQHRIGKRTQVSRWAYHQARQTPLMAAVMSAQYEGAAALVAAGALANHSDLTRPHPKWWFVWRIIPGLVILGFSNTCTSTQQERGWTCEIRANGLQLTLRKGNQCPGS